MRNRTAPPEQASVGKAPQGRPQQLREDMEFLPAALEIIETPPSPIRIAVIYFMVALVTAFLAWSWIGTLDVVAIGRGKLQPSGRVKVIQAIETAKVRRINVENGRYVAEGQVLVEFDSTEASAEVEAVKSLLSSLGGEIARRDLELAQATLAPAERVEKTPAFPPDVAEIVRRRETHALNADLGQLDATLSAYDAQTLQKRNEHLRLTETIVAQTALVATLEERVDMRAKLARSGSGSVASVIDATEALRTQQTNLISLKGQLRETVSGLEVLKHERERSLTAFVMECTQKRNEAERNREDLEQRLVKARSRLDRMTLRSPVAGSVEATSLYSVGQVATVGQELMRIVPAGEKLEIVSYFLNQDIGFVHEGQEVTVKVDSFPFTRYGSLTGRVSRISRDAIPLPDAQQIEGNPGRPSEAALAAGAQRTQNLVFPVTITPEGTELVVDGRSVAMSPGMTVVTEIRTGSRRLIDYLLSPISETTTEALRER